MTTIPGGALDLFNEEVLGVLATIDEDGSPRATPLHIFYGDGYAYWFSKPTAEHSRNVASRPRVSVTLFSPNKSTGLRGVYIAGLAEEITGDAAESARELVRIRLGTVPEVFQTASVYRVPLGKLDSEKTNGNCWYFYT